MIVALTWSTSVSAVAAAESKRSFWRSQAAGLLVVLFGYALSVSVVLLAVAGLPGLRPLAGAGVTGLLVQFALCGFMLWVGRRGGRGPGRAFWARCWTLIQRSLARSEADAHRLQQELDLWISRHGAPST